MLHTRVEVTLQSTEPYTYIYAEIIEGRNPQGRLIMLRSMALSRNTFDGAPPPKLWVTIESD